MKRKSVLAFLLAFVLILTAMPITGSAADAGTYSLDELMGSYEAMTRWEHNETAGNAPALSGIETGNGWMGNTGDAVEMRIKTDTTISMDATDNDEHRFNLTINSTNISMYTHDNGADTQATNNTVLAGQWVTLLVINNGPGYDVYYKLDGDTNFRGPLFETTTARTETVSARSNIWFYGTDYYIDYVQRYEKRYGLTDLVGEYATKGKETVNWSEFTGGKNSSDAPTYPLGDAGDALEMRFKAEGYNFNFAAYDNNSNYFKMQIQTKWQGDTHVLSGETKYTVGSVKTDLVDKWITVLVVNKGTGFDVHYKSDSDVGYSSPIISTTQKATYGTANKKVAIATSGTGTYSVDYIKYYKGNGVAEAATKANNCSELYRQDFDTEVKGTVTTKVDGTAAASTVTDGHLVMAAGQETQFNYSTIPDGGYVEFRFKTDASLTQLTAVAYDGTRQVAYITLKPGVNASTYLNDAANITETSAWPVYNSGIGHNADTYHTYRIVRNGTNYSAFHNIDGDPGWTKQIDNAATDGRTDGTPARFNLVTAGGTAQIDYVRIYGPAGEEGLLITDGSYTTPEVTEGATISGDLRAIVSGKSGSLIFAGYDAEERFVTASVRPVDGTAAADEEILDTTALDASIKTVKVFFWNSLTGMVPVTTRVRSVSVD